MDQQVYFQLIDDLQAIADELEAAPGYDMIEESSPVVMDEFNSIWEDR